MKSSRGQIVMSKEQIRQKALAFQLYECTKKLFLAVHNKKHVVVYGKIDCGKEQLEKDNAMLLSDYNRLYFDFDIWIDRWYRQSNYLG